MQWLFWKANIRPYRTCLNHEKSQPQTKLPQLPTAPIHMIVEVLELHRLSEDNYILHYVKISLFEYCRTYSWYFTEN